jgi:hypothetical protein
MFFQDVNFFEFIIKPSDKLIINFCFIYHIDRHIRQHVDLVDQIQDIMSTFHSSEVVAVVQDKNKVIKRYLFKIEYIRKIQVTGNNIKY